MKVLFTTKSTKVTKKITREDNTMKTSCSLRRLEAPTFGLRGISFLCRIISQSREHGSQATTYHTY